ncbi:hypothetical protein BT63DRAFT_427196 [Microthyrium microscopicum]|uniref:Lanthionine synthetase C family protein n=1 Tax=Microthyrium microscopicum TaxID=703497 RepID=A0A6A6U3R8_9PEZI|nr:hypothetical protein BT63DRAFT_427196 [Microthyrium microscopicum]
MADALPRYYPNELELSSVTVEGLERAVSDLTGSITEGLTKIEASFPILVTQSDYGHLFTGWIGVVFTYIILKTRAPFLDTEPSNAITQQLDSFLAKLADVPEFPLALRPGRSSPIVDGPISALLVRFMQGKSLDNDARALQDVVDHALKPERIVHVQQEGQRRAHDKGVDEVLAGRCGFLWMLLQIVSVNTSDSTSLASWSKANDEVKSVTIGSVEKIYGVIIDSGIEGAKDFIKQHNSEDKMPLMWPWLNEYYGLGAVHGMTGNLSVLILASSYHGLSARTTKKEEDKAIISAVSTLCRIGIKHNGHLPMATPPWPTETSSNFLVQLCHGAPGLLYLLAVAALHGKVNKSYTPLWLKAIRLASNKVWEEGILSKGGSLCHGLAGNAWAFLLLHDVFEYQYIPHEELDICDAEDKNFFVKDGELSGDWFLERGLALLMECRNTKPFADNAKYRLPDTPYSLFEGLAGITYAWADALFAVKARLKWNQLKSSGLDGSMMKDDKEFQRLFKMRLGIPGLAGPFLS